MLGLSYAAAYPADIAGLVLVGCGTYDEKSRLLFQNALEQRLEPDEREHIAALSGKLAHESSPEARDAIFGELGAAYTRVEVYDLLESDDTAEALPTDALGFRETWDDVLRLQREGIEPASFGRITAPVLMLHGADDPHPGPATRDLLRQFMPQLEYIELPRCGHEPWRERFARARFIELVRVFCERISGHGASEP
jgi:pimeloyl-ACP methyl ester carboxylesterase